LSEVSPLFNKKEERGFEAGEPLRGKIGRAVTGLAKKFRQQEKRVKNIGNRHQGQRGTKQGE